MSQQRRPESFAIGVDGPRTKQSGERDMLCRMMFSPPSDEVLFTDYSCALKQTMLLHGRMFLTNRHVCFYSNLFGFEKKLVIPMESVTRISKGTTLKMLSNAVRVFTRDNADGYFFTSFWGKYRDECFGILQRCVLTRTLPVPLSRGVF